MKHFVMTIAALAAMGAAAPAMANEALAKDRAFAVRDLLLSAGLTEDQVTLQKPADNNAGAGDQARRVDVALQ